VYAIWQTICTAANDPIAMSAKGHVWTAPWQELF
jgi:hypothetical protein